MSEDGNTLSRLGPCNACQQNDAMYTCPRCSVNTCSLACVNRHKRDTGCSGHRNKTMFVSIQSYGENNLISDYRFLEEISVKRDAARRGQFLDVPLYLTGKRKALISTARRHRVDINLLPDNFTKSRRNYSNVTRRNDIIMWTVECVFPHSGVKFTQSRVDENKKLSEFLEKYLHPVNFDPLKRQQIKLYVKAGGLEKVKILFKSKAFKNVEDRGFYVLDPQKSIRENLRGMCVIEYPSFHIILEDRISEFKILKAIVVAENSNEYSDVSRNKGTKRRREPRNQRAENFKKAKWEAAAKEKLTKMDTSTSDVKDKKNDGTTDASTSDVKQESMEVTEATEIVKPAGESDIKDNKESSEFKKNDETAAHSKDITQGASSVQVETGVAVSKTSGVTTDVKKDKNESSTVEAASAEVAKDATTESAALTKKTVTGSTALDRKKADENVPVAKEVTAESDAVAKGKTFESTTVVAKKTPDESTADVQKKEKKIAAVAKKITDESDAMVKKATDESSAVAEKSTADFADEAESVADAEKDTSPEHKKGGKKTVAAATKKSKAEETPGKRSTRRSSRRK